jgi:hypothetical protein
MEAALIAAFKATPCYQEVLGICCSFENVTDDVDAKNVAAKDKIMASLWTHGYCTPAEMHCKEVGGTPFNRGNEGLLATRSHRKVVTIKASGYSPSAIDQNLLALQDNPYSKEFAKYTSNLHKVNKMYAPYKMDEVKVGSLGASHAVHGFACTYEEVETDQMSISINGKISKEKVYANDEGLRNACEGKLKYAVIRWEVFAAIPLSCKIISKALNTVQQVAEGESWMELMLGICDEATNKYKGRPTESEWKQIQKSLLKSQPPRWEDIPDIALFVKIWGGLPSAMFVKMLGNMLKKFNVPSERIVSGSFFKNVASLKFPLSDIPADLVNALVFVHAVSNESVQDHFARYITKGDCQGLALPKKRDDVTTANNILKKCRKLMDSRHGGIFEGNNAEHYGNLMIDIVQTICDKKKAAEQKTFEQSATEFLKNFAGEAEGLALGALQTTTEDKEDANTNNVVYTETGDIVGIGRQTLMNKGLNLNMYVSQKDSKKDHGANASQWKIVEIMENGTCKLVPVGADGNLTFDKPVDVCLDTMIDTYKETAAKEFRAMTSNNNPLNDKDLQELEPKGLAAMAMMTLLKKFGVADARIMVKPARALYASRDYAKEELIVVPASHSLTVDPKPGADYNHKAALVTIESEGRAMSKVVVNPEAPSEKFASQYWCIDDNSDPNKTNCNIVMKVLRMRKPTLLDKNTNPMIEISVPVITNVKEIKKNDEIIVYRPSPKKAGKKGRRPQQSSRELTRSRKCDVLLRVRYSSMHICSIVKN